MTDLRAPTADLWSPITDRRSPIANLRPDDALVFISENLAKGNNNYFTYYTFSKQELKIELGDVLQYDIYLDPKNPVAKGGIDINFSDGGVPLRDAGILDSDGVRAHGDGIIAKAVGQWYTRHIPLDGLKGRTANQWDLVFEGDLPGQYVQFLDNVEVIHPDGTHADIYTDGPPSTKELGGTEGYTKTPTLIVVDRAKVVDHGDLTPVILEASERAAKSRAFEEARKDIVVAQKFAERNHDPALEMHIKEATALLDAAEQKSNVTADEIQAALHAAKHALSHTHPMMEKYTGHLVGHAHIDLQWLWEWQEGIVATYDTFNQATKFMDEFPGFTFSQSSSCLYQTTEEHYPEFFKKMQEKVKKGQWEIVGGRVCEGDTNMISPESHARHFLYGQRYFREKFGKTAVVGWEPDTFGHTIQMPQILKLGGCNYYYFCRGGKQKPLFWWQGLDGTKILTFDEPASGSWYNSDLSYHQFQEMLDFQKNTGSKDMLWVYGVGNHGGGPTREYIQTALGWMKDPSKPTVKFSTATQFFKKLETYNLIKIPVIDQELNPVFDGCYTTHSEIKQLNRNSEAMTSSAEAVAAVASLGGFNYPQAEFRRNWEDICFNHHHDTLPGSGIHAPYERTKTELGRVLASDKDIITRALESIDVHITPKKGGISVLAFNPTGWKRSGWIETYLVQSGWDGSARIDPANCVAEAPDGKTYPVVQLDDESHLGRFWAADVPAFGYRVFNIHDGAAQTPGLKVSDGGYTIENDSYIVEFDQHDGGVRRLFDKRANREVVTQGGGLGRLETHWEDPHGMSAWVIGKIAKVETDAPNASRVIQGKDFAEVDFEYRMPSPNNPGHDTQVVQKFRVWNSSDQITCDVDCNWQAIGSSRAPSPMLRLAFDVNAQNSTATYEVPFGALARPTDGTEFPALKFADIGDGAYGLSVLNDSKHGYSANGSTLRLTLIRSSYEPDPVPNPGFHHWRYSILPHAGDWKSARIVQEAAEFNQPLLGSTIPFDGHGDRPLEWSPLSLTDSSVVATALKRAEDDKDLVLRVYQSTGASSNGAVRMNMPITAARWVNFLEDDLGNAQPVMDAVPMRLHGYEIRTVKIRPNK